MDNKCVVCLICCDEFKGDCDDEDLGRKEENVESLQKFCEVILEKDNVNRFNGQLTDFLENPNDNLTICANCLDLMKTVTEARLSAKCVEESVEKLQMLLLRELRRLQGRLDLFWGEFRKMEGTLVNGDLKLIENNLDGSYPELNDGGKRLSRKSGKISQREMERKNQIFGFRQKICQVFGDFHQFKKKLNDKIACSPISRPTRSITNTSPIKTIKAEGSTEKKRKSIKKPADKQRLKDNHKVLPLLANLDEIESGQNELDDEDVNMDDDPMPLDTFDDNEENSFKDIQVETNPIHKRTSLRCRDKIKYKQLSSSDEDDPQDTGKDESEEYKPEVSKTSQQVETKLGDKRGRGRHRKQDKQISANSDQDEMQSSSEHGDEEFKPKENLSIRAKIYRLLRKYEPHLAQLPPFKSNVIRSVLKCQCFNENLQNKKGADKLNVFQRHMIHLSYNVETQLINLKDVPIKILCQAEEENGENGLLCMKCELKVPESPKMETLMWEHVLSKHLNAYQCPHCKDKQYENQYKYNMHVYKCLRRREKVDKVECEICGKSLCNRKTLEAHRWSHMNEQEKAEALKSGLVKKVPTNSYSKRMEKRFQCEQCGKSFATKAGLQKHEETHKERDSREQFICPKCGKSFLKAGYEYHLKYDVTCGEDDPNIKRETCGKCGRILKNKMLLKRHMSWAHPGEDLKEGGKTFICGGCGKGFRRKGCLKLHEITHSGEKPWNCEKCGKGFGKKFSLRRHEATCVNKYI